MTQTLLRDGTAVMSGPTLSAFFSILEGEHFTTTAEHHNYLAAVEKDFGMKVDGYFELVNHKGRVLKSCTIQRDQPK